MNVSYSRKSRRTTAHSQPEDLPCVETARTTAGYVPESVAAVFREHLWQKYSRQRLIMALVALFSPLLHTLCGEYDFVFVLHQLPSADLRALSYFISAYGSSIMIAATFPTDPSSVAGKRFIYVPIGICVFLRCVGVLLDVYHTSPHLVGLPRAVHLVTAALLFSLWASAMIWRMPLSWAHARVVHSVEGALIMLCALGMRVLGPAPVYSPGQMSFEGATARGMMALLLGTVVLAPENRLRIAREATRLGWTHVTIKLSELRTPSIADSPSAPMMMNSSVNSESELSPTSFAGSAGQWSHHTAKVGGGPYIHEAERP